MSSTVATTQAGLVLLIGEKIFKCSELKPMCQALDEFRKWMTDDKMPSFDLLNVKSTEPLANGWFVQPWADGQALNVFAAVLEHVSSGAILIPKELRFMIMELLRNYGKTSSRTKMLVKGGTSVGVKNYGKQVKEVMDLVEHKQMAVDAVGKDYVRVALRLQDTVNEGLDVALDQQDVPVVMEVLHNALVDINDDQEEALEELANVCQGLAGEEEEISECGLAIGNKIAVATDVILGLVMNKRRILIFDK
jgi:hypothetical protein